MEERKSNFDGDNRYYGDFMGKLAISKVLMGTLEIFPFLLGLSKRKKRKKTKSQENHKIWVYPKKKKVKIKKNKLQENLAIWTFLKFCQTLDSFY